MDYPATRAEAKRLGATHYFTGKPCVRGHIAPRRTKGSCTECDREDWPKHNAVRREKPESEASKASKRRYYEKNREKIIARALARPAEVLSEYRKRRKEKNPDIYQVAVNTRRRRVREATPRCLSAADRKKIRDIYMYARLMSTTSTERYVVDHILPIKGKNYSGLHVPWNLRVMTHTTNCSKWRNDPDVYDPDVFWPDSVWD